MTSGTGDAFGLLPWWEVEAFANVTISLAMFTIAALIIVPLARTHQLRRNTLAVAAAAVFFCAAVGRAFAAASPFVALAFGGNEVAVTGLGYWWRAGWNLLTAAVAVYYLVLRRRYARQLVGAPLFNDLVHVQHVRELEVEQAKSAARAQAEAERDSSARMLRSIIDNDQSAIYVKDLDGRFLMVNAEFERIFAVTEADIQGLTDEVLDPELAPVWRAADFKARQGGYQLEEVVESPDGRLYFHSAKFPLHDAQGSLYATCGVSLDVTEQKRAVTAIAEARDDALAAAAAKSTFLATMSHEIRTPMNAVIGMTDLLLDTDMDEEQQEFLNTIRLSGDALLVVINDVLDFSKIESGALELESEPFDLCDLVENCLDQVVVAATAKGLELVYHVDEDCPSRVTGDVVRVQQILVNLLSNAVKFTEHGEVLVAVSAALTSDARIQVTLGVTDTGIGIAEDSLHKLFQSFSQVDAGTTRLYGGSGLGLAISQRLAEAMHGGVNVISTVGSGSTFTATVVLDQCPDSQSEPVEAATLTGRSALLVDDNPTNLRILDYQLASMGITCTTALSAAAALAMVSDGLRCDVAVLDMHMPHMDGAELAAALKLVPGWTAPIILLTSLGERPTNAESLAAFITKPAKRAVLRNVLVSALTGRPPSQQLLPADADASAADDSQPLRVLLVEDSVINQRVTQLILAKIGQPIDIVGDGQEAVHAVQTQAYDVILMDVQMPTMDGLEATRRIRASSLDHQPHIVAMTANAQIEDRQACRAAGMDAYLAKPVRAGELRDLLIRIGSTIAVANHVDIDRSATVVGQAVTPASSPVSDSPPPLVKDSPADLISPAIDMDEFEELMTQFDDPDGEIRDELIASYLADGDFHVSRLVTAAGSGDVSTAAAIAHAMRTTSALLGAAALADLLHQTEHSARNTPADLHSLALLVDTEYARVSEHLLQMTSTA